jgi:hypothetical protein
LARNWYKASRFAAVTEGDNAALSAILHNVAAYQSSNLRLQIAFSLESSVTAKRALLEVSSSVNYDEAIGTESLEYLTSLMHGLVFTLDDQYESALAKYASVDFATLQSKLIPVARADQAWCSAKLSRLAQAWHFATDAIALIDRIPEADDLAYACRRIHQVASMCEATSVAIEFERRANQALAEHRVVQAELATLLGNCVQTANEKLKKNPA